MKSEEIAKIAGVSRSTVSRVINNYSNVPDSTRKKVLKIIKQYKYEPNLPAQFLAGKGLNTIGLFIVSIADEATNQVYRNNFYNNSYFAPFSDGVIDIGNGLGYYILINTVYRPDDFVRIERAFTQSRIDGGIIIGLGRHSDFAKVIIELGKPLVLIHYDQDEFDQVYLQQTRTAIINTADYDGMTVALQYLTQLGHSRIGTITGSITNHSGYERLRAYRDFIHSNNLPHHSDWELLGNFNRNSTQHEVKKLALSGNIPTALVCGNDDMALIAMEELKHHGFKIPDDISIIGFDDIPMAKLNQPSLTTLHLPIYEMAEKSVLVLNDLITKKEATPHYLQFPTELVLRESCKKITVS